MKAKIKITGLFILLMLMMSFTSTKQTPYILKNALNCDVVLQYEVWRISGVCMVCTFGSITVPANSKVNLPVCGNWVDICINISTIGGDAPPSNHTTLNVCHTGQPSSASGTTSTSSLCGSISWVSNQWPTFGKLIRP